MSKKKDKVPYSMLVKTLQEKPHQDLLSLHADYSERMRLSGAQIWIIGSIFIPLSLSGIALGIEDPYQTLVIGIFSLVLVWVWYLISFVLRDALERDYRVLAAIETVVLDLEPPLLKYGLGEMVEIKHTKWYSRLLAKVLSMRRIRLGIPMLVTLVWIIVVVISWFRY
jgi:hypothetical protein